MTTKSYSDSLIIKDFTESVVKKKHTDVSIVIVFIGQVQHWNWLITELSAPVIELNGLHGWENNHSRKKKNRI